MTYQPMVFTCALHNKPVIRLLNSREFYHTPDTGEPCRSTTFIRGYSKIPRADAVEMGEWVREMAYRV